MQNIESVLSRQRATGSALSLAGLKNLSDSLCTIKIEVLSLAKNGLRWESLCHLQPFLKDSKNLLRLDVSYCDLGLKGVQIIVDCIDCHGADS